MNALQELLNDFEFDIDPREKLFVENIFAGLSMRQAGIRAGYSESTNLKRVIQDSPAAQAYARYLQQQHTSKFTISREQVTEGILGAIEDAKMLEEPNTQINGWRELGRLHGLYAPEEKKVTLSTEKQERLRQIEEASDADLLDYANAPVIDGDFTQIDPPNG